MVSSRTTSGTVPRSPPSASTGGGLGDDSAEALVLALRAPDAATRLRAVRKLKNDVISNRGRKARFLAAGAAPALVDALRDALVVAAGDGGDGGGGGGGAAPMETGGGDSGAAALDASGFAIQAAAAVSSLAYGTAAGADAVRAAGGVGALLEALASGQPQVAEAGVRSLRLLGGVSED
jgi:hypothetical protein